MKNATDFLNSNFFRAEDLDPNVRIETTIVSTRPRDFEDGETKLVAYTDYQGGKGIVFNQTRLKACIAAWGPNLDNWVGKPLIVKRGATMFKGDPTWAVVVEPVVAERIAAEPRRPRPAITSGGRPPTPPEPPPINCAPDGSDEDMPF
jgi:hypothetical protein